MKRVAFSVAAAAAALIGLSEANAEWTHCAERGPCRTPVVPWIHDGWQGSFTHHRSFIGALPCSNDVFGDPIIGWRECFVTTN